MSTRLYIAPAGAGKTAFVVAKAQREAQDLRSMPHVVVASALQARDFRRRLAEAGGAIGVRIFTFEELYRTCLLPSDGLHSGVPEAIQRRVLRAAVQELPLRHYASLRGRPGFVHVLKNLIDELKAAQVTPKTFAHSVTASQGPARLQELASIYASYQEKLSSQGWVDAAGLGWMAAEALASGKSQIGKDWGPLLVDGFDDFTSVQLRVLALLSSRVKDMVVTLTGMLNGQGRPLAHRRFDRTRLDLMQALGVRPAPLPESMHHRMPPLKRLEAGLFQSGTVDAADQSPDPSDGVIDLFEAVGRAAEVRAALRWLKAKIVEDQIEPHRCALVARDLTPYRAAVTQTANEFGLPVHIYTGQPLPANPAVAALTDLLKLMLPVKEVSAAGNDADGLASQGPGAEPALPPRLVIEAWRSPYFDWSACCKEQDAPREAPGTAIGIEAQDADALGIVARRGRVIEGLHQWEEAFAALHGPGEHGTPTGLSAPQEDWVGQGRLTHQQVRDIAGKFEHFVRRLRPPEGQHDIRHFVRWLEVLMGPDPEQGSPRPRQSQMPRSLNVVAKVRSADDEDEAFPSVVDRDLAALRCLKKVLRELVWAAETLHEPPLTFATFLEEVKGALEAVVYHAPIRPMGRAIVVADVVAARGVPFRALAVVGMAEGVFPAPQSEDPLLWDSDREALDLGLEPSTQSAEAEYFYETVSASTDSILLTRPRLADDGEPWEASPFWEEVQRLVAGTSTSLSPIQGPRPDRAASLPEVLQSASATAVRRSAESDDLWAWLRQNAPSSVEAIEAAAEIVTHRSSRRDTAFDGGLHHLEEHFGGYFHAGYSWSASRLEAYRRCPFFFFVGKVLDLQPRDEPVEGIGWLERGLIYHHILERVYRSVDDPTDLELLLGALPEAADSVLDEAPERQAFRPTAWWEQTRQELVEDVRRSLEALANQDLQGDFVPIRFEAAFGLEGEPALVVADSCSEDAFKLRGFIDRIDRNPDGQVRVIDYKAAGPHGYSQSALHIGEKVQLPLYALAARDALGLGQPLSGFYWHVRHAEPSSLKLEEFGPEDAIRTAVARAWEAIRGARGGRFEPNPPSGGCPPYCPAVGFCWHYEPRYGS